MLQQTLASLRNSNVSHGLAEEWYDGTGCESQRDHRGNFSGGVGPYKQIHRVTLYVGTEGESSQEKCSKAAYAVNTLVKDLRLIPTFDLEKINSLGASVRDSDVRIPLLIDGHSVHIKSSLNLDCLAEERQEFEYPSTVYTYRCLYSLSSHFLMEDGREVYNYYRIVAPDACCRSFNPPRYPPAAHTIVSLLKDNPHLIPTFDLANLAALCDSLPYLVIDGDSVDLNEGSLIITCTNLQGYIYEGRVLASNTSAAKLFPRYIFRHVLMNTHEETCLKAVRSINTLIQGSQVIPMFDLKKLDDLCITHKHLTIFQDHSNTWITLSEEPKALSNTKSLFVDYFSGALIKEPVICNRREHAFEKDRLSYMPRRAGVDEIDCPGFHVSAQQNGFCVHVSPQQNRYSLGSRSNIQIDFVLKAEIEEHRRELAEEQKKIEELQTAVLVSKRESEEAQSLAQRSIEECRAVMAAAQKENEKARNSAQKSIEKCRAVVVTAQRESKEARTLAQKSIEECRAVVAASQRESEEARTLAQRSIGEFMTVVVAAQRESEEARTLAQRSIEEFMTVVVAEQRGNEEARILVQRSIEEYRAAVMTALREVTVQKGFAQNEPESSVNQNVGGLSSEPGKKMQEFVDLNGIKYRPITSKAIATLGLIECIHAGESADPFIAELTVEEASSLCKDLWDLSCKKNSIPLSDRSDKSWGQHAFRGSYSYVSLEDKKAVIQIFADKNPSHFKKFQAEPSIVVGSLAEEQNAAVKLSIPQRQISESKSDGVPTARRKHV